jgi:hypothetical protein
VGIFGLLLISIASLTLPRIYKRRRDSPTENATVPAYLDFGLVGGWMSLVIGVLLAIADFMCHTM